MKGISPVIASVMLLLMAVAAVGGFWVFFQRMQATTITSGAGQADLIREKAAITIAVDLITIVDNGGSDDTLTVKLANAGGTTAKTTRIVLENVTNLPYSNTTTLNILPNTFSDYIVVIPDAIDVKNFCPAGTYVRVTVYSDAAVPIRDYPIECKY